MRLNLNRDLKEQWEEAVDIVGKPPHVGKKVRVYLRTTSRAVPPEQWKGRKCWIYCIIRLIVVLGLFCT